MVSTTEIIREIMAQLAPKEHRSLPLNELLKIGYGENAALQIVKAYEERPGTKSVPSGTRK